MEVKRHGYLRYRVNSQDEVIIIGGDSDLVHLVIPPTIEGKKVVGIGIDAFIDQIFLESVELPNTLKTIGTSAFEACKSLEEIVIPEGVTLLEGWVFYGCPLKKVTLPSTLKVIGDYTFIECNLLEEISIPDSVTSIGESAFSDCTALKEFRFPKNLIFLGNEAFRYCISLKSISFYKNPDRAVDMGSNVFNNCKSLEKVELRGE